MPSACLLCGWLTLPLPYPSFFNGPITSRERVERKLLYRFEKYVLDTDRRELRQGGDLVRLAPQVFDILVYLIHHRDRVISKDDLMAAVWGGRIVSESALTTRLNGARKAIGDSGEEQRLIKTLPRRGVRFVGDVREEKQPANTPARDMQAPIASPVSQEQPSIVILPFTNLSGDPLQDYFTDGVVEDITTELSRSSELFVIARNSSFTYKGQAVDVRAVGRDLGVRYVLEGSVRKVAQRVRITGQLIDAESGKHIWADRFESSLEDIFALQDQMAHSVVGAITPKAGAGRNRAGQAKADRKLERLRSLPTRNGWLARLEQDRSRCGAETLLSRDRARSDLCKATRACRRLLSHAQVKRLDG